MSRGGCFWMLVYAKLFNFVSFYLVTFLQQTHPQLKLVFGMMPSGYHLLSCLKFIQTWYPKYTGLDFLQFIAYRIIITTRKISTEYSSFVFWHHQVNLLICSWWQVWAETTLQGLVLEVLPHLVITPIVLGLALSSSRSADRLPITSDPQKPRISHCLQLASNRFVPNFVFCSSFTSFGN